MKRILLVAGMAGWMACNNNGESNTDKQTDSADHGAHGTSGNVTVNPADTSGIAAGTTMMSLMHSMMDDMKKIPSTGNPDNDFAALMKSHHLGAIEMARLETARGTVPEIKGMAQKMMNDQQKEVAELNAFLSGHSAHGGGDAFYKEAMASMNKMNMDMDHSGSVDKQFVQMMIPHHQSAVDMAKAYLKTGAHEEKLKTMANNIISSQQKEIQELQAWLNKNQ